jgi:hypothetical protein
LKWTVVKLRSVNIYDSRFVLSTMATPDFFVRIHAGLFFGLLLQTAWFVTPPDLGDGVSHKVVR